MHVVPRTAMSAWKGKPQMEACMHMCIYSMYRYREINK